MSDFDFDEIDRAVSGVLNADSAASPQQDTSKKDDSSSSSASTAPEPRQSAPLPAARRSSGRFMDVVHPSSDMRSPASGFTPPAPSSPSAPQAPTPPAVASPRPTPSTDDALSFETNDGSAWDAPLVSPFLPDAKVEKRPLGGTPKNDESLLSLLEDEPDEPLLEAPDDLRLEATTMPDPIDFAAHAAALPSENEDTGEIASESPVEDEPVAEFAPDTTTDTTDISNNEEPLVEEEVNAPEATDRQLYEGLTVEDVTTEQEPETVAEPTPELDQKPEEKPEVQAAPQPIGPTSITQQYEEQPSAEQSSGAIYDTEAYHKPIAPVVKHKSGVWTILWITLLIILGAGAGVAVYLFVLPLL